MFFSIDENRAFTEPRGVLDNNSDNDIIRSMATQTLRESACSNLVSVSQG